MKLWKVQKFASDVVYDLRSRNLLLIVIVLAVGIIAAPLAISKSGEDLPPSSSLVAQNTADLAPENQTAVVAYEPGVRNYKKRLKDLTAKDPFIQQFTGSGAAASALNAVSGAVDTGGTVDTGTTGGSGGTGGTGGGGTGGGGGGGGGDKKDKKGKTKTKYYSFQTDVQVGETGAALVPFTNIPQFAFLPSQQIPVLVFLGTTSGGSQAIFLVSKDVGSVGGEGVCFPGPDSCQLIGLNPGKGADFVYTPDGKTYHLQVDQIRRVVSSKPPTG
jgi:hypothetical protein